mmetsp:Transcript_16783/g.48750  ORF Transcript_16783/g.48750 Transcript_16783/m.48750 type:complete len:217 (-) Transcript_16783:24-674(-)
MSPRLLELARHDALTDSDLVELNQGLLDAIAKSDWDTYAALVAPDLSCLEPEAKGQVVEGLDFHRYYFDYFKAQAAADGAPAGPPPNTTLASPNVRWMCGGEAAVLCYARLIQRGTTTIVTEETRVWEWSLIGATIMYGSEAATVARARRTDAAPARATHQLTFSNHRPQWVRLVGNTVVFFRESQQEEAPIPFTLKDGSSWRWRLVHFHRSEPAK